MMRKSKRQVKPKTVFDPSETTTSMDIDKDEKEKEIEESTLMHSVPDINPWDVTNFESFVFYECPECNHKSQGIYNTGRFNSESKHFHQLAFSKVN